MDLWLALFWGSPIGLGIFFMGLGVFFIGVAQLRRKKPVSCATFAAGVPTRQAFKCQRGQCRISLVSATAIWNHDRMLHTQPILSRHPSRSTLWRSGVGSIFVVIAGNV